ncbi:MAG: hypothetical protein EZS28_002654 [Streblomastix strix]|uniref:Uncharacterized protein n=1 Tax=Streblomastix strix TaxID=222440 RepID=A0A5J4X3N7_9EUKA|nr:MAG: hypothetical protein EZS28_002654 [Streblomastix strix]
MSNRNLIRPPWMNRSEFFGMDFESDSMNSNSGKRYSGNRYEAQQCLLAPNAEELPLPSMRLRQRVISNVRTKTEQTQTSQKEIALANLCKALNIRQQGSQ